jgi:hypothetical protein
MKLTAKTDLEVPAAVVFAALIDTPTWEREAIRNGVEVERPAGHAGQSASGPNGASAAISGARRAR